MSTENQNGMYLEGPSFMPDGKPVPELLTEEETIIFLRLDCDGPANPSQTLKYYRDKGLLRPTRIGKYNRYSKRELLNFIDLMTDRTSKQESLKMTSQHRRAAV